MDDTNQPSPTLADEITHVIEREDGSVFEMTVVVEPEVF